MRIRTLAELQTQIVDKGKFNTLSDYSEIGNQFLRYIQDVQPTRIISPSSPQYIFFQYDTTYAHRITRPLNSQLFIENVVVFNQAFKRFVSFLSDLRRYEHQVIEQKGVAEYLQTNEINKIIYTMQQSIGCIGDSFSNSNQSRKRIGQLFERLITLVIREIGLTCEPRTISIPIPDYPGYRMPYELDVVFSHGSAVIASETHYIHPHEIVGSIKTTSKDRIDKIFLDKHLLTKLLGRDIPVIAIFLHDVQRAVKGGNIFGVNSTFKTNHFLGYTVALSRLDGVYYVDPRPAMTTNERLNEQIHDFQQFLVQDLWTLSSTSP